MSKHFLQEGLEIYSPTIGSDKSFVAPPTIFEYLVAYPISPVWVTSCEVTTKGVKAQNSISKILLMSSSLRIFAQPLRWDLKTSDTLIVYPSGISLRVSQCTCNPLQASTYLFWVSHTHSVWELLPHQWEQTCVRLSVLMMSHLINTMPRAI